MKFDWYQASIPEVKPAAVMAALAKSDYYGEWQESRPLKGYDAGAEFNVGGETRFRINFGGQNEQHGPNVLASGGAAPLLAQVIRRHFPRHRVSRLDSCEDFHHRDAYPYLRKIALRVAKLQKVQCREIVKPIAESDDGRTLYLGGASSAVTMRIYEKGKQLGCGTEWVRAELQVRPQKDVKQVVATLSPVEVWGIAKWSHSMGVQIGNTDLQRVDTSIYQPSDHDRAYHFMLGQYRKVLEQMHATHGSWDTVGAQIGYDLAHRDEDINRIKLTARAKKS